MGRKDNDTRTFRLPNDLLAALDEEAARTGLSRNVVACQWLAAGLAIERQRGRWAEVSDGSAMALPEDATTIIYDAVPRTVWVGTASGPVSIDDLVKWPLTETPVQGNEKAGALGEAQPATTER